MIIMALAVVTYGLIVGCSVYSVIEYRNRTIGVKKLTREKWKEGYFQRNGYDENGRRIIC